MPAPRSTRRLSLAAVVLAGSGLLGACAVAGPTEVGAVPSSVRLAEARMPPAPRDEAAWSAAVAKAYAAVDHGRGAEAWLRDRMSHRRPGERLAVIVGIDDVMVQTHFGGTGTLVPRTVQFVRMAHALGYSVFYVTGRSYAQGLGRIEAFLARANVPAAAFYGRPVGASDEQSAKAECRAAIQDQGYTLAMSVAADAASFVGAPRAEAEIRLPDFARRG